MKESGDSLDPGTRAPSSDTSPSQQSPAITRPGVIHTPPILPTNPKDSSETTSIPDTGNSIQPEYHYHGQPDPRSQCNHRRTTSSNSSHRRSNSSAHGSSSLLAIPTETAATMAAPISNNSEQSNNTSSILHLSTHTETPLSQLVLDTSLSQTFHHPASSLGTSTNPSISASASASIHTTAAAPSVEVVMKSAELESPNTMLRHRRSNRSTHSTHSTYSSTTRSPAESLRRFPTTEDADSTGDGTIAPPSLHRKPSFSSTRDHVPSGIKTEQLASSSFKIKVDEASPISYLDNKSILVDGQETGRSDRDDSGSNIDNKDDDDIFDWEEDKIYEVQQGKVAQSSTDKPRMLQDDVCCRPLHYRIHPWILKLIKHTLLLVFLLIPKYILHHVHLRHHETIVLIEDGKPYMGVVVGNHIGYFVTQLLIMALFKIIHKFGSVKVKITLETHDGLVPHIARSCWLFALIGFWAVFVHNPTCVKAKSRLDLAETLPDGVDMHCRRWIFWWVYRCLWGIQAMNMLYIMKRYSMQILSDRFEQDNSKFVELNFQGHVLDGLQKIKQPRANRLSSLHAYHHHNHLGQYHHHYRWAEKSTSWLANTYQGARSPGASRPGSPKDEKPLTASIVADSTTSGAGEAGKQQSTWQLLKRSIVRRTRTGRPIMTGTTTSIIGSITEGDKDHELEPQEFFRMSKKRKSKLIHSLRNKPIENPNKKAKDLWARICPSHRNHLERMDLEQPFKKEIMDRVWKLFDPNGGDIVTRAMFKQTIVDMVNLRKSFTSTHKTFENAMAKLDMLFNGIVLLFVIVAFLIAYDVGVQQFAVGVSSLVVGCAFVTGTSAKNAFESMVFIFVMGAYFTIITIHILSTELKRGDGMHVFSPNYVLATRNINNLSRSSDHVENIWMDIPLFSTARTIQKLKQKIQTFVEGEAVLDFLKIDVILNATNNHTKDGTSKACLQVLFRVFHRSRWVDSEFGPRKLKSILFLRAALNELEQEDLKDLIALRRAIGYGNHGGSNGGGVAVGQDQVQQQQQGGNTSVVNEAGVPVGFVGTSGNIYDLPGAGVGVGSGQPQAQAPFRTEPGPEVGAWSQNELGAIYLACDVAETVQRSSMTNALQQNGILTSRQQENYGGVDSHNSNNNNNSNNTNHNSFNPRQHHQQPPDGSMSGPHCGPGVHPGSPNSLQGQQQHQHKQQHQQKYLNHNLDSRHILVPETIQLSTNAANFQPFPNGFQFQR
ncbi:MAG: hypothetical protein J3R72DRAFT_520116 [Linnemannia gamsii]|nr:MAG: hypothetical protein J3R72DRAFT_520116 [Linnemannia gamsii]